MRRRRAPRPRRPATPEEIRWKARASRYRREVADWCELCEWRDWQICAKPEIVWRAHLSVHHCFGRGCWSPLGEEPNYELRTLCRRCHAKITRRQFELAIAGEHCDRRKRILDAEGYGYCVKRATDEASIRRWARGWHRTLLGPVPVKVSLSNA